MKLITKLPALPEDFLLEAVVAVNCRVTFTSVLAMFQSPAPPRVVSAYYCKMPAPEVEPIEGSLFFAEIIQRTFKAPTKPTYSK